MTELRNLRIIDHGFIRRGSLFVDEGKIAKPSTRTGEIIEGQGLFAVPGFIDMHVHGAANCDFMDAKSEGFEKICEEHLKHGVTTIVPTSSTGSFETIKRIVDHQREYSKKRKDRQYIPGIHVEGQYIADSKDGGMDKRFIHAPIFDEYRDFVEYAGTSLIRWSAAPELEGSLDFGEFCKRHNILVSIAHSNATYRDVEKALEHGYSHITHFYSDMNSVTRENGFRVLGAIEAGYELPIDIELIADGCHIPPDLFKYILRHIDYHRINLVSDSIRPAGAKGNIVDGKEIVNVGDNGREIQGIIEDGVVKFLDRSAFHGSIAMGNMLLQSASKKCGIDLAQCVTMMTENPARMLGLKNKGNLDIGKDADIVLLDDSLEVTGLYYKGKKVVF